ncbi:MAG: CsgG/HfaB family protein [Synechococcales bacterium]|nr:CsgG/HfaB family protein [Synechococcales bacterium]
MPLNQHLVRLTAFSSVFFATALGGAIASVPTQPMLGDEAAILSLDAITPTSTQTMASDLLMAQATRPRIAILDFDYTPTIGSYLSAFPGFAEGVSVVLVDRLVNSGNYTVIERSQIEAVLAEQNLGQSGRVDASTAAQIGRILGVDAVISRLPSLTMMCAIAASALWGWAPAGKWLRRKCSSMCAW